MQKDSAQAKILLKVVVGLLFLTHPVETCICYGGSKPLIKN